MEAWTEGVTEFDAADAGLVPKELAAATEQVYVVPPVSPTTVIGLDDPVPVNAPGLHVATYVVIADPPFAPGGAKLTTAAPFPAVALPMTGAAGEVA